MIKFRCNNCLQKIKIPDDYADDYLNCPKCQKGLETPSPLYYNGEMIDKYEVDMLLGKGNNGEVYLARDTILDMEVALKILIDHGKVDEETKSRFLREVQTMAKIDHPNVVYAKNAGRFDKGFYIAMTYVNGFTLEDLLDKKAVDIELIRKTCLVVASAMSAVWDQHKIIHRDIKPANIMCCKDSGSLSLTDLGLAKSLQSGNVDITSSDFVLGSPYYMSPEQVKSSDLDCRSDIYSLGATLYHLACGVPPFSRMTPYDILVKKTSHEPPADVLKINKTLPEGLVKLIRLMMRSDKNDRIQNWEEVIDLANRV